MAEARRKVGSGRPGGRPPVVFDIPHMSGDDRALVSSVLRGQGIPHELAGDQLRVPARHRAAADVALAWATERNPGPWAPPASDLAAPDVSAPPGGPRVAGRGRRLAASMVDAAIFSTIGAAVRPGVTLAVVLALVRWSYDVVLTATTGQTLGKMALGIRVVATRTGQRPRWSSAVVRTLVLSIFELAVLADAGPVVRVAALIASSAVVLPILWDPQHRGLHDRAAGTVVVPARP